MARKTRKSAGNGGKKGGAHGTGGSRGNRAGRKPRRAARAKRGVLGRVLYGLCVVALWLGIAGGAAVAWYAWTLPDVSDAFDATRRPSLTVLAADGTELATVGDLYGLPVSLDELPPALPHAVIATEDRRFYDHFGLDPIGLARALWVNIRAGRIVQGGSTITQQVAKNLFLTPDRTIERKVQEALLALWLEHRFTKDQILTVYLNRVYLGAGAYGVDAAARRYFDKPASELSTWQSAMLAGLLKAPSRDNPIADAERARARTRIVLANMVDAGYLTEKAAKAARADPARTVPAAGGAGMRYFVDWISDQVPDYVTPGRDLVVQTTLDPALQSMADAQVSAMLDGPARDKGIEQAGLVVLSPDGAVKAMVGGRDYGQSQFNRAVQARRQPGSAFKPFVYLAGLEAGLTPDTRIDDAPITVDGWSPRNFDGRYRGAVRLADGLADSINTVAVRVAQRAGLARVAETARRLGAVGGLPATPSLALGAAEVTLLNLTAAYAAFANGGYGVWPYGIEEIRTRGGDVLYRRSGGGPGRVIDENLVGPMNRMLARVITDGTGRAAALDRPAAGKTGTSQDHRDAWFIGYTADYVTGVWMGNDDASPTRRAVGGGLPARLWRAVMAEASAGLDPRPLPGTRMPEPERDPTRNPRDDDRPPAPEGGDFIGMIKELLKGGG